MASITAEIGPQAKTKNFRAAVSATTYPGTAQFTGILFRARAHIFLVETTTQVVSFSQDGTNDFLVLNGAFQTSAALDQFHVNEIWIKIDTGSATVQITAWA